MCCFAPPVEEEAPRSPGTEEFGEVPPDCCWRVDDSQRLTHSSRCAAHVVIWTGAATPDLRRLNSPVPPTLGEMRGSSMARSVRAVSMRLSRAISSIFYDAEAPGTH